MRLRDACSLLPELKTETWNRQADLLALHRLARWCERYTPIVAVVGEEGLWLDMTGAAHLFGGEQKVLADLEQRLHAIGFANRLGLAETPGAAWAMARFSSAQTLAERIVAPGNVRTALASLPLAALRLEETTLYLLKRFGLKTVSDLQTIPRVSLKRRFASKDISAAVLHRLDQALGQATEPLVPVSPEPVYCEHISCPEPILATQSFHVGLQDLLQRLCQRMEQDDKGATALTYAAYHADGGVSQITIATATPSRNIKHLISLFRERIDAINPGFGVDHLALYVDAAGPLKTEQMVFAKGVSDGGNDETFNRLLDRLSNRLGIHNVQRAVPCARHVPERAEMRIAALQSVPVKANHTTQQLQPYARKPQRPLRLLDRPEPVTVIAEVPEGPPLKFTWRRVAHHVVRAEGPERIAPEWWRQSQSQTQRTRDYYRVEDRNGRCFWLYREGLYRDGEARLPTWHMHGVFA